MRDRGVEMGLHGWRHEHWGRLERGAGRRSSPAASTRWMRSASGRAASSARRRDAEGALAEVARAGLDYCSLGVAGAADVAEGVPVLPFAWRHVDACAQLDPRLDALRTRHGDPRAGGRRRRLARDARCGGRARGRRRTRDGGAVTEYLFLRDAAMRDALRAVRAG